MVFFHCFWPLLWTALLLSGCTSLEGIIYQEKALEHSECRAFSKQKYDELSQYLLAVCLTHGQLQRITAIDDRHGLPSLQEKIYQICVKEEDTTLEVLLFKDYGATIDGDVPGVDPDSAACQQQKGK
ncbi:MAG: hypothetical protein D4R76_02320 [Methylococcus sp.]|nr:MAG: hypothetical protein D4R76_02320 [Methylococcus sp.]